MRTPLYILTFLIAFFAVTGILIVLNDQYNNIFKFDFTPRSAVDTSMVKQKIPEKTKVDSLVNKEDSLNIVSKDSLVTGIDSSANSIKTNNLTAKPEINNKPPVLNKEASAISNTQLTQNVNKSKQGDSTYAKWKKATIKIYESMDSKKIAKIILSLTDNEARELIYSMKKKKAAEILSYLNPDEVKRLTRLQ